MIESDWKLYRKLRPLALERYCQRVLDEIRPLCDRSGKSSHERYLAVFRLVEERDKLLADLFNDPRRSTAFFQLAHIHAEGLLTEEEFACFSEELHAVVRIILDIGNV
ncbi:MAG: peptide ABC transporter substrate-binding protein [Planctomycetaceae bacterium]|nr:MAG: peptide ABC transporter substrate-binding protein [Planctomycetaceae bacterium]